MRSEIQLQVYLDDHGPYQARLTVSQEYETFRHLDHYERDENWRYTDAEGHEHHYVNYSLPTLKAKMVRCDGACGDPGHREVKHYRCKICREKVKPGTKFVPAGEHSVPGLRSTRLEVDGVSEMLSLDGEVAIHFVGGVVGRVVSGTNRGRVLSQSWRSRDDWRAELNLLDDLVLTVIE